MRRPSALLLALLACAALVGGCKRRDFPEGFSKAYLDEAIKMTEAIVPYCKDVLVARTCPSKDPDDESIEYRSPLPAGSSPIFEHPFQGSDMVLQYDVECHTLEEHPKHPHTCEIRSLEHPTSTPDECEELSYVPSWGDPHRGNYGESLRVSTNPNCPLPQFRLGVVRSTPGKGVAMFYGVFLKPGTKPPWRK